MIHASLFSGIGGPEVAAKMMGWENDSIVKRIVNGEIPTDYAPNTDGTPFRLSPLFTEEMMGFPFLWTTLPFLKRDGGLNPSKPTETQSSRK